MADVDEAKQETVTQPPADGGSSEPSGDVSPKLVKSQVAENDAPFKVFLRSEGDYVIVKGADAGEDVNLDELFRKVKQAPGNQVLETIKTQDGETYRVFKCFDNNYAIMKKVGGEFSEQVTAGGFLKIATRLCELAQSATPA